MTAAEIQFHSQRLNVNLTPAILAKPVVEFDETIEVDGGYEEFWGQMVQMPSDSKTVGINVITKGDLVARAANRTEYRAMAWEVRDVAPKCENWGEFIDATKFHTWPEYRLPQKPYPVSNWDPFKETA
jgi:hypothetical protein